VMIDTGHTSKIKRVTISQCAPEILRAIAGAKVR
jgi:hypothetical protein